MPEQNPSHVTVQRANDGVTRHQLHEGRDHLVVPVVMIKEGVLNGAFLSRKEFGKVAQSWNGRPVTVAHPEQNGGHVSASSDPKTLERTVGKLFNSRADGDKLKAEAWIDVEKAKALGHSVTLATLEAGAEGMEVSTGYWADAEPAEGDHNGRPYTHIDRNIVPDHLALLPGEIGACSWGDGCGVRANQEQGAFSRLWSDITSVFKRHGVSTHCAGDCSGDCNCNQGGDMPDTKEALVERGKKLHANKKLTPEQMDMLQNLGEDNQQLTMARAFLDAVEANPGEEVTEEDEAATMEEKQSPVANKDGNLTLNQKQLNELVANQVKDGMRRERVLDKLSANSANAFNDKQLAEMSTNALETYEQSIRPRDYSGQGGFAANSDAIDNDAQPLTVHRGVLAPAPKTEQ